MRLEVGRVVWGAKRLRKRACAGRRRWAAGAGVVGWGLEVASAQCASALEVEAGGSGVAHAGRGGPGASRGAC